MSLPFTNTDSEEACLVTSNYYITGADTGFPEGGGVKTFTSTPPLDIVRVTSSALQKMTNTPILGHSQAPPLGHCPCDVIHIYLKSLLKKKNWWSRAGGVTTPNPPPPGSAPASLEQSQIMWCFSLRKFETGHVYKTVSGSGYLQCMTIRICR